MGEYRVNPNDHVNMAQSTNDVFPTSMRIAALDGIYELAGAAGALVDAFDRKAREFDDVVKPGRTHMQDAVPIRLGRGAGRRNAGALRARSGTCAAPRRG